MQNKRLVLASQSPRRAEILTTAGYEFTVRTADTDETVAELLSPAETVETLARRKALAVEIGADELILAADTVVALDGAVLGKPKDKADAFRMLRLLSGRTHEVCTGVCLRTKETVDAFSVCTRVTFHTLTDREIENYLATGEPFDKAGAYGIQGRGCLLVKEIEGDYFNVVGLPISEVHRRILANTAI